MHGGSEQLKLPARKRNGRLMQTSEKVCEIEMEETTGERSAKGSTGEYSTAVRTWSVASIEQRCGVVQLKQPLRP